MKAWEDGTDLCMVLNGLRAMILRRGRPMHASFFGWRTAPVLRICYGHQARLLHHRRHLRRQVCVFLLRCAASALRLLLGSSVGMASDASRPYADAVLTDQDSANRSVNVLLHGLQLRHHEANHEVTADSVDF